MENIISNIYVDENTDHYYKLRKSMDKYIYFECVVKSCENKLTLLRETQNKTTKNEHNHTQKEGKNASAVLFFKARLKEIAMDPAYIDETPKAILTQTMNVVRGFTFPPGFKAQAQKLIRNTRFRSKYVFSVTVHAFARILFHFDAPIQFK